MVKYNKYDYKNHKKLKELIVYIADRLALDPHFGATKLNKILFYSDFNAYAELGKPITGEPYYKLHQGPAPRFLIGVREEMEKNGDITISTVMKFEYPQHRIVARRMPDLKLFTPEEISIVERVIEFLADKSAAQISEESHFIGWKLARDKEDIPYETVFIGDSNDVNITPEKSERAKTLAEKYGLL